MKQNEHGVLAEVSFQESVQYILYIKSRPTNDMLLNSFHKRFGVPFEEFERMSKDVSTHDLFHCWTVPGCIGTPSSEPGMIKLWFCLMNW